jgi:TolB protein
MQIARLFASHRCARFVRSLALLASTWLGAGGAGAQTPEPATPSESLLGELLISGSAEIRLTPLAILPSFSPEFEDVVVRSVVRRDFELTGMFKVIPDDKAPPGSYAFDDPVDIKAWRKLGAEVIVKLAAQKQGSQIKIFGLAYFENAGPKPVYEKTFLVNSADVRVTAHRITDALLGAITGRNGGFASHLTFAARSGKNTSIYSIDADGQNIRVQSDPNDTAIAPVWGPNAQLFFSRSRKYGPFQLLVVGKDQPVSVPFKGSVYSAAFSLDYQRLAVAVAENLGSAVYVGAPDGTGMKKVSQNEVATHPVFSPSGKIAWIGGGDKNSGQRVYVEGKAVSPSGFSAAAPTFCDTEDGVLLVYAVGVGGGGQDLVMSNERGGNMARLTQGQGSNSYPACSPDGRLISYFSKRSDKDQGLFIKSLKNWQSLKISNHHGESLRWAALPPVETKEIPTAPRPVAAP